MTRFDRRKLLFGAGGALLAMPVLESLLPRTAWANPSVAPKRLIVVRHNHGRIVGNGLKSGNVIQDRWSPLTATGALPAGMSLELAALDAIRSEVVTIDAIDNIVRHLGSGSHGADGHYYPSLTSLTCVLPKNDGTAGGPSIDYVAGLRLRANAAMPASIVIDADSGNFAGGGCFWGANGTAPNLVNNTGSPTDAINAIFSNAVATAPPTPTLKDRLTAARPSILDRVLGDYTSVRAKVSTADQTRLDQHMQFIRDAESRYSAANLSMPTAGCKPLTPANVPSIAEDYSYSSAHDNVSVPVILDTVVQALSCDVTRSIAVDFSSDVPTFDWLFPNGTPFTNTVWHAQIHGSDQLANSEVANVQPTFGFYAQMFTQLVQKLALVTDVDGQRLLDNTLVLWVSDLGYGSTHGCFNYPVVMAGLKSGFAKGQGRHVVPAGRASLGDVYAQALRMLGGTDMTFGTTGTLQSAAGTANLGCDDTNFCSDYGYPGHITPSTPLHSGPLDL